MIKFVELECPNCGGDLEKTGVKSAKCKHCGAEFLIDEGQPGQVTNIYQAPQQSKGILPIVLGMIVVFVIAIIVVSGTQSSNKTISTTATSYVTVDKEGITSELFQEFVKKVYGVSYEKVSKKQLAQITYLHVYSKNDCKVVEYAMEEGETQSVELPDSLSVDMNDLANFTGLQKINAGYSGLTEEDLKGLDQLTEIYAYNSPEALAQIVENPEKILVLGCYDGSSVTGIDAFPNLEKLYLTDSDLNDIGGLSALKNLKTLEISSGDAITDFGVLYSLTGLEELYIDSETLKDISFVQSMPALQSFSLKGSIVLDVSALNGMTSLKHLSLLDNDEVQDFSALSSLSGLEELTLELGSSQQMPSVENWTNLTYLDIDGADDISFLSSLPALKSLSIAACSVDSYGVLSSLQNLESLTIGSMYGDIPNLDVLASLTNLKTLDISALSVYGNVDGIFAIPNLEELNVNDCSFELNFDSIPENTSLKRLHMSRMDLLENISVYHDGVITYLDYDKVNLADHIDFVSKFPNLEELYVQSNKLTGVEFTASLPNLQKLDITGNYVTDLRPLSTLENLQTVWCGENAISQGSDLGEDVTVIMDSEADRGAIWK